MTCGMERRRVRNRLAIAIEDAEGGTIEPDAIGIVDPHDERIIAGIAAGDLDDLGPVAEAAHVHPEDGFADDAQAERFGRSTSVPRLR